MGTADLRSTPLAESRVQVLTAAARPCNVQESCGLGMLDLAAPTRLGTGHTIAKATGGCLCPSSIFQISRECISLTNLCHLPQCLTCMGLGNAILNFFSLCRIGGHPRKKLEGFGVPALLTYPRGHLKAS